MQKGIILFVLGIIFSALIFASPVAHWKFDEGTGSVAYDSSGSNNATVHGASWTSSGKIGGALSFDGSNDYVAVGVNENFTSLSSYTVNAWVKFSAIDDDEPVFSLSDSSTSNSEWMQLNFNRNYNDIRSQGVYNNGGSGFNTAESQDNIITTSTWFNVAWVIDGNNMYIYKDGVEVASSLGIDPPKPSKINGIDRIVIGARSRYTSLDMYFDGVMDEIVIWNRALDNNEISFVYQNGVEALGTIPEIETIWLGLLVIGFIIALRKI